MKKTDNNPRPEPNGPASPPSQTPQAAHERGDDVKLKSPRCTLRILSALADNPDGLTVKSLMELLQLSRGTAYDQINMLREMGFARYSEQSQSYTLGPAVYRWVQAAVFGMKDVLREIGRQHLREIVNQTQISAHMAFLKLGLAVYEQRIEAATRIDDDVLINVRRGRELTPQLTAVGRALMCDLGPQRIQQIFEMHPTPRDARRNEVTLDRLMAELDRTRRDGYAVDDEETAIGVVCVAAPVLGAHGRVLAAIGVSGKVGQLSKGRREEVAGIIVREAEKLSRELGYDGPVRGLPAPEEREAIEARPRSVSRPETNRPGISPRS